MTEIRDQIIDAQLAALNASLPSGVPQAEEEMLDDLPEELDFAISIGEAKEVVVRKGGPRGPIVLRHLFTAVDCWARGSTSTPARKAISPLLGHVTAALGGNRLGGLIDTEAEVEIHWRREHKDTRVAHATVFVETVYVTKVDDATVRS